MSDEVTLERRDGVAVITMRAPERRVEGFVERGVHASYLHTHWAAEPGVARRFVERCRTS